MYSVYNRFYYSIIDDEEVISMQDFSSVSVVIEKVMMVLQSDVFLTLEEKVKAMKREGWNLETPPRFMMGHKVWQITLSHANKV